MQPDAPPADSLPAASIQASLARMAESMADLVTKAAAEIATMADLSRVPPVPDIVAPKPGQGDGRTVGESANLLSYGWGPIDPRDYGIGDDARFVVGAPYGAPMFMDRRKRGECLPIILNEQQLRWLRWRTRWLCANNDIALSILENRTNYAVGTGLVYKAVLKPGVPDTWAWVARRAQAVIDAFSEINWLPQREVESLVRTDIDGEAFLRLFPVDSDCILRARVVEPDFVRSPTGRNDDPETTFGVHTARRDVEDVRGYWIVQGLLEENPTPEFVPASEVVHFKSLWTPSTSKRGITPFYPIEPTLRMAEDLMISTASLAKARAKIAMVRRLAGAVASVAAALVQSQASATLTDPRTSEATNIERLGYGSILTVSDQTELEFPNANIAASDHVAVFQMLLRTAGARFCMPEYMISGDASNNNRASAMVAESPFVTHMTTLQDRLAWQWGKSRYDPSRASVIWRQLRHAATRGVLPMNIAALIDVQCQGPALVRRDPVHQAQSDSLDIRSGIKSRTTCQLERGLDPDAERQHFQAERGHHADADPDADAGAADPNRPVLGDDRRVDG